MFDFLDKTGLKTVLEQIKAKFPSSLPADGGNADTVDDYHVSEAINMSGHIPPIYFTDVARINPETKRIERWNTDNIKVALANRATNADTVDGLHVWTYGVLNSDGYFDSSDYLACVDNRFGDGRYGLFTGSQKEVRCDYASNANTVDGKHAEDFIYPRAMLSNIDLNTILYPCSALIYGDCTNMPPVSSWGTLLCYSGGTGSHVQLWVTATDSSMFMRHYEGNNWGNWKEISTTPIKSTGWITTPTNGNGEIYLPEGNSRKYLSFCSQGAFSFIFYTGSTYAVQIRDGNMAIVQSIPITYIAFYID